MNCGRTRGRRLDAAIGMQIFAGREPTEVAFGPSVFEAWILRPALTSIEIHVGKIVQQSILGLDVNDTGSAQPELSREGAGEQTDAVGETRTQHLAETGNAFGELNPVDAILKIGMIAAHVNLSKRILGHPGGLQQHLVQRCVATATLNSFACNASCTGFAPVFVTDTIAVAGLKSFLLPTTA